MEKPYRLTVIRLERSTCEDAEIVTSSYGLDSFSVSLGAWPALRQLAAALGFRLEMDLVGEREGEGGGGGAAEPEVPEAVRRLMTSTRVRAVARQLAGKQRTHASLVTERLQDALLALGAVTGGEPSERDLDRLLDLVLLSGAGLGSDE